MFNMTPQGWILILDSNVVQGIVIVFKLMDFGYDRSW